MGYSNLKIFKIRFSILKTIVGIVLNFGNIIVEHIFTIVSSIYLLCNSPDNGASCIWTQGVKHKSIINSNSFNAFGPFKTACQT